MVGTPFSQSSFTSQNAALLSNPKLASYFYSSGAGSMAGGGVAGSMDSYFKYLNSKTCLTKYSPQYCQEYMNDDNKFLFS